MGLMQSYLVASGRTGEYFNAIHGAQAPERFTTRFLEELGYKSTNDRLLIAVLKGLGFLDAAGVPKQRYFEYLDGERSKQVMAEALREAYEDLFRTKKDANKFTKEQLQGKFKSLTQGQLSDSVIDNMARTFLELVKIADFEVPEEKNIERNAAPESPTQADEVRRGSEKEQAPPKGRHVGALTYRIEVVLPPTRDRAVYDAIFRSLKEHLL
jgi:hypothetical protein